MHGRSRLFLTKPTKTVYLNSRKELLDWGFLVGKRPRRIRRGLLFSGKAFEPPSVPLALSISVKLVLKNLKRTIRLSRPKNTEPYWTSHKVGQLQAGRVRLLMDE